MNPRACRSFVFVGLLAAPVLALAREGAPSESPPAGVVSGRSRSAIGMGVRGHSLPDDAVTPEAPAFVVDVEQPVLPHVTVFGGFHLGVGMDAVGLQAGSRLYLDREPFQGLFLALQAEGTLFERSEDTRGNRTAVGALLGYSQSLGDRWLMSLGAGADFGQTRTETAIPPSPECVLFTPCLLAERETRVEKKESVQPLVRVSAVYRF